jgi:hypothetical protein
VSKLCTVASKSLFSRLIYDVVLAEEFMYHNNLQSYSIMEIVEFWCAINYVDSVLFFVSGL